MFAVLTFSYVVAIMIPICLILILPKILIECSICFMYYDTYNHLTRPHKRPSYVKADNERRRMLLLSKMFYRITSTTKLLRTNNNDNDEYRFKCWIMSLERFLNETVESWEQVTEFHINIKELNAKYKQELKTIRRELKRMPKSNRSQQEITNLIKFIDLVRTFEF
ncbi:hypothetical protein HUG17_5467 [Dermatophagoides farinae]|uniref:Uncharacterized protein n=1 Tax=Dermatophagoides farinae TaxID=6954 RepID=A0A9D4P1R4_DERFA|nr:uncharacterized protein LOC124492504 [Dermatophagoides farinae]KAH7642422.1 hypothetical protein HUG17_5467 [Dermatophagoides farinae]